MKRSSYRTGLKVEPVGGAWGTGAVLRVVTIAAVLFIALTIIASVAVAQKIDQPPVPDPINGRSDTGAEADQETAGGAAEILRLYTFAVEPDCSFDPLSAALSDMLAAGRLKEAPLLKNNQLHMLIGEAYLADLSALPCVQEVVPNGREPQEMIEPDAPSLEGESQPLKAGTDAIIDTTAAGSISGAVTDDESGLALPGITVQLYNYPGPETGWLPFTSTDTVADGTYFIADLPDGTYRIGFFDWLAGTFVGEFFDDVFSLNIAFDIPVAGGAVIQDKNAALSRPGQITGIVQDAVNSDLLEGIDVHAYKQTVSGWEKINSDVTSVDGTYVIDDLPSGLYSVRFDDASGTYLTQFFDGKYFLQDSDDVEVNGGTTTSGINAFLTYSAHITGTVTAEAGSIPLENIEVCALVFKDSHWESLSCDFTDSSGDYDVGSLPPGTYRVLFSEQAGDYNGEFFDDSWDLSGATDVFVTAGATVENINAALSSAGHITGMVTTAVGGDPLMDIRVCAVSFINFDWRSVTCDYTDAEGQYDLSRLPAAEYNVDFYDQTGRYVAEYFLDTPNVIYARDVSVANGGVTSNIDAVLEEYGKISGNVAAEASGTGLESIKVCARYVGGYSDYRSQCTFTAADGGYEVGDLYPGTYFISFQDHTYTYIGENYNNVGPEGYPTEVLVAGGQLTMGIDAALAQYGRISGTVTAEDGGAPLPSIHVYAFIESSAGWTYAGRGDTSNNGGYEIGPLASGNYLVEFYDSTGTYMTEYFDDMLSPEQAGQVAVAPESPSQGIDAALPLALAQDVALTAGWNMISSNVLPADPAMETLFEYIENDVVLMKNGDGEVYWPANRINQIGDWNEQHGYQIYMNSPATLRIGGAAILPRQSPIDLLAGWNMVAYLGDSAAPAEEALASIVNQLYLAKDGNGDVYWPEFGINQFGDMAPGQGYKLYMLEPGTLTYPDN